jgi:hypothetical protein
MIRWDLFPSSRFEPLCESWDALNLSSSRSALLDARFVALLLRFFGGDHVRLAVGYRHQDIVAMALVTPGSLGTWTTFQPDQAPLGMWLCAPGIDSQSAAHALFARLPGRPLLFGILHRDPDMAPRPSDTSTLSTLDYIRTARLRTDGQFDDYWAARGKNLRHNLKRQRNRLDREGTIPKMTVATTPEEMAAAVADYGGLESAGWKTALGTAVSPDNRQGAFYRALLETFAATGDAFAYRLHYNDRPVACDLCIRGSGVLNWLKTTYDESQTTSSPAALLRQEVFALAFADPGTRMIEFYGPVMDWHTKWANDFRTLYHLNIYRWPGLAALHRRLRRPSIAPPAHESSAPELSD